MGNEGRFQYRRLLPWRLFSVLQKCPHSGTSRVESDLQLLGKSWLFEGGIRVPLIVRWRKQIPKNQVSGFVTYNTDHFPTLLDLLDLPLIPERHIDGVSIKQELVGNSMKLDRPYYWVYTSHQMERQAYNCVAYRVGNFKLIHWYEHNHTELYNLANDIGENHNLSYIMPAKREQMKAPCYPMSWLLMS